MHTFCCCKRTKLKLSASMFCSSPGCQCQSKVYFMHWGYLKSIWGGGSLGPQMVFKEPVGQQSLLFYPVSLHSTSDHELCCSLAALIVTIKIRWGSLTFNYCQSSFPSHPVWALAWIAQRSCAFSLLGDSLKLSGHDCGQPLTRWPSQNRDWTRWR